MSTPRQDALHDAIQQHAPKGDEAVLTGWVVVAERMDHDGHRWLSRICAAETTNWAAAGMHHEALYGEWPDGEAS